MLKRVFNPEGGENCYLIFHGSDKNAGGSVAVIDPGFSSEEVLKAIGNLPVTEVILTHGHLDHIYALSDYIEKYKPVVYICDDERDFLTDSHLNTPVYMGDYEERSYHADVFVKEGDIIDLSPYSLKVLQTPGHTPGSVCLLCEESPEGAFVITGDTLFRGDIGRTDFPGSDPDKMLESLKRLLSLDGDIRVFPGHGLSTSIKNERKYLGI